MTQRVGAALAGQQRGEGRWPSPRQVRTALSRDQRARLQPLITQAPTPPSAVRAVSTEIRPSRAGSARCSASMAASCSAPRRPGTRRASRLTGSSRTDAPRVARRAPRSPRRRGVTGRREDTSCAARRPGSTPRRMQPASADPARHRSPGPGRSRSTPPAISASTGRPAARASSAALDHEDRGALPGAPDGRVTEVRRPRAVGTELLDRAGEHDVGVPAPQLRCRVAAARWQERQLAAGHGRVDARAARTRSPPARPRSSSRCSGRAPG